MAASGVIVDNAMATSSPYDAIADFYQRAWADWYLPSIRPALERLFFPVVRPGASVLDVCCGCGHVTRELQGRGFRTTGLDASRELIRRARADLPGIQFVVADARNFNFSERFDGALSTFDSLNHLLSYGDLRSALGCVHAALTPGSPFVFDMNLEEAYGLDLGAWVKYSDESAIGFVRGLYDRSTHRARTELIWFSIEGPEGLWRRSDAVVEEQCYTMEQIGSALQDAGFRDFEYYSAAEAGATADLGYGRLYVRAWA